MSNENINDVAEDGVGASAATPRTITTYDVATSEGKLRCVSLDDITFVHGVGGHGQVG